MRFKALACTAVLLAAAGCTPDWAKRDESPLVLRITKITGQTGGETGDSGTGDVLNSDVSPVFNDNATLTLDTLEKNLFGPINNNLNDVLLQRYEVRYIRSDGRNAQGLDVPFAISGPMATLVPLNSEAQASIIVVRHQAKLEPPLANLRSITAQNSTAQFSGAGILTVIAEITVHGRTSVGHAVQATGRLQINFANFVDNQ